MAKITYIATDRGLERANRALKRDFGTHEEFIKKCSSSNSRKGKGTVGKSTVNKFFKQKGIQRDSFITICKKLKLSNWQEIAELEKIFKFADIAAGPIWNNDHAQKIGPKIADLYGGEYTGQWRTVTWNEMSVVQIKYSGTIGILD